MRFLVVLHLMLAGIVGIYCEIKTVTEVSVKAGGSISIPCLYGTKYKNNLKYLCKGEQWQFCKIVAKTKQKGSGKFSISDDIQQSIFTVTIINLTNEDKHFYCAVDKLWYDVKQHFMLSVAPGTSSLYVNQQEITAFERGNVTITCHYTYQNETAWCKLGGACVRNKTGSIDGTSVTINTRVPGVFSVTMSNLRTENSGWYWCANENFQIPVHITVYELSSTILTVITPSPFTRASLETLNHTHFLTNSSMNVTAGMSLQDESMSSTKMMILIPTLILLLTVLAALLGWTMIKHKKTKPDMCDITMGSPRPDPVVFYTAIDHNQGRVQIKLHEDQNHTEDGTYSIIETLDYVKQMTRPTAPEENVIYSTLQQNKPR